MAGRPGPLLCVCLSTPPPLFSQVHETPTGVVTSSSRSSAAQIQPIRLVAWAPALVVVVSLRSSSSRRPLTIAGRVREATNTPARSRRHWFGIDCRRRRPSLSSPPPFLVSRAVARQGSEPPSKQGMGDGSAGKSGQGLARAEWGTQQTASPHCPILRLGACVQVALPCLARTQSRWMNRRRSPCV